MNRSLGILEVTGTVTAAACIDAMVKSAFVEVYSIKKVGSGLVAIMIKGDLASVNAALEVGAETASRYGELAAFRTIARPYEGLEAIIAPEEKGDDQ